jgi:hypothetical protein
VVTDDGVESFSEWQQTMVLAKPRFQLDVPAGELDDTQDPSPTRLAGQTPLTWLLSAIIVLILGIAAITLIFSFRERRDPYAESSHKDSLFDDTTEVEESDDDSALHPALAPGPEPPDAPPEPAKPEVPESSGKIDSHVGLPGGGEYAKADGVTWYVEKDGTRWKMDSDGGFERLD